MRLKKINIFINKFIVHHENIDPKKIFSSQSLKELNNLRKIMQCVEEVVLEICRKMFNIPLHRLTPIYSGDPYTIFMVPWLKPAYFSTEKVEKIKNIDRSSTDKIAPVIITLTDNSSFYIEKFPPEYRWEGEDEVIVFNSYNYESPLDSYIIFNLSKKQWIRAAYFKTLTEKFSWLYPDPE